MSNLPPGSSNDPFAPWNKSDKLCRYCDAAIIRDQIYQALVNDEDCNDDCVDEQIEITLSEYPLCTACAKEEYYDNTDED